MAGPPDRPRRGRALPARLRAAQLQPPCPQPTVRGRNGSPHPGVGQVLEGHLPTPPSMLQGGGGGRTASESAGSGPILVAHARFAQEPLQGEPNGIVRCIFISQRWRQRAQKVLCPRSSAIQQQQQPRALQVGQIEQGVQEPLRFLQARTCLLRHELRRADGSAVGNKTTLRRWLVTAPHFRSQG